MTGKIKLSAAQWNKIMGETTQDTLSPKDIVALIDKNVITKRDARAMLGLPSSGEPEYTVERAREYEPRIRGVHLLLILCAALGWILEVPILMNVCGSVMAMMAIWDLHKTRSLLTWLYEHRAVEEDRDDIPF
jgi:hypothetical protein